MTVDGIRLRKRGQGRGIALTESIDCLVGIRHNRDAEPVLTQPCEKLEVERIAVLSFVDDYFVETRRDRAAKASGPLGILQPGQRLNPRVSRAQISLSPK